MAEMPLSFPDHPHVAQRSSKMSRAMCSRFKCSLARAAVICSLHFPHLKTRT
jgi:hypothetical protein